MTDSGADELTHEKAEEYSEEQQEWPQYYSCGEGVEDFTTAYYRVEGPNGPVSFINPGREPVPTTMHSFAMEAESDSFTWVPRSETPWADYEQEN